MTKYFFAASGFSSSDDDSDDDILTGRKRARSDGDKKLPKKRRVSVTYSSEDGLLKKIKSKKMAANGEYSIQ